MTASKALKEALADMMLEALQRVWTAELSISPTATKAGRIVTVSRCVSSGLNRPLNDIGFPYRHLLIMFQPELLQVYSSKHVVKASRVMFDNG